MRIGMLLMGALALSACNGDGGQGSDGGPGDAGATWTGPVDEDLGAIGDATDAVIAGKVANFRSGTIPLRQAFRKGAVSEYWDFGATLAIPGLRQTSDVYMFVWADNEEPVAGQAPIFDTIPGDDGYSDFWRVVTVKVPRTYEAQTLKSSASVKTAATGGHVELLQTTNALNCPVVAAGTVLENNPTGATAIPSITVWYEGYSVAAFDFSGHEGFFPVTDNGDGTFDFPTAPIYPLFRDPDGPAGDHGNGNEVGPIGGNNIIDVYPPAAEYSPLWEVTAHFVSPLADGGPDLLDTSGNATSDIMSLADLEAAVAAGDASAPVEVGMAVNCPSRPGETP